MDTDSNLERIMSLKMLTCHGGLFGGWLMWCTNDQVSSSCCIIPYTMSLWCLLQKANPGLCQHVTFGIKLVAMRDVQEIFISLTCWVTLLLFLDYRNCYFYVIYYFSKDSVRLMYVNVDHLCYFMFANCFILFYFKGVNLLRILCQS